MKIFTFIIFAVAFIMIAVNIYMLDFSDLFSGDSLIALIGIVAALCAIILMIILHLSKKINNKVKTKQ